MEGNHKKRLLKQPQKFLSAVLSLTALHSFLMGFALIIQPTFIMKAVGFGRASERFFATQGGVFHILMGVAYLMGAVNIKKYIYLIVFAIIVKIAATFFLIFYCFTIEFKWIILLAGICDFIMGLVIFISLKSYLYFPGYHSNRRIYE